MEPISQRALRHYSRLEFHAGAQPTRLIVAWGDTESISYHQANVAKGEVILFGGPENADAEPLAEVKSSPEVLYFDVTTVGFSMWATPYSPQFLECCCC